MITTESLDFKRLFKLCIILIVTLSGIGIIAPILPLIQAWGEVSTSQIGFYVSSFALARLFTNIPVGAISDRYGSRLLLIIGTTIIMLGMLMSALAPTFLLLVIGRIITGIGSAIASVNVQMEMLLLASPAQRVSVMSYFMLARRTGTSIFPFIAGALAVVFDWRAVFYFCVLLNLVGLLMALMLYYQPPPAKVKAEEITLEESHQNSQRFSPWILPSLYFATLVIYINRVGLEGTNIPLFGGLIGLDSLQIGITLSVASIVSLLAIYLGGRYAERYSCKKVFQVGLVVLFLTSGLFFIVHNYALFFIANLLLGLAAFTVSLPMAIAANLSLGHNMGRSVGSLRFFMDCGMLSGPIILGWLMDHFGFHASVGFSMVLLLMGFVLTSLFLPKDQYKGTHNQYKEEKHGR